MNIHNFAHGTEMLKIELNERFEEVAKLTGLYLSERDRSDLFQRQLETAEKELKKARAELAEERSQVAARSARTRTAAVRTIGRIIAGALGLADGQRPARADAAILAEKLQSMGFFDSDWYLERNPDVRNAGMDAAIHYLRWGLFEGREPCSID